jgi:microcin C transport system substrate-binding protein
MAMVIPASGFSETGKKVHAMGFRAEPKYPANFSHFDWADPAAKKGGTLRIATDIPFDKLNYFALKGVGTIEVFDAVFETLAFQSLDEAFTVYGLLAESMELASDGLSVTFYLHPKAAFSDGKPVTADDVVFSFKAMTSEKARPQYAAYYADVKDVIAVNNKTVKFTFKQKNPELHLILGQLHILPKHFFSKGDFGSAFNNKVLGSGPYVVKSFSAAKNLVLERNPNYWGKDLTVNKGRWNYDTIQVKVYRDPTIKFEGLKAGEYDFDMINISKMWAVDVAGEKWDKNWLVKTLFPAEDTQGLQGYIFNVRKPLFQDPAVRKALAMAFDFEWSNETLFYGQYKQFGSYFDNSELSARGTLPSAEELKLLEPLKNDLPKEVFTEKVGPLGQGMDGRARLLAARKILADAGWKVENGTFTKDGKKLAFTIMLDDKYWERITEPYINNLKKLGVDAKLETVDGSIYEKRIQTHDYDIVVRVFPQSESPGNEQRYWWHSSEADKEGSRNTIGIKNKAVDALVEHVIKANSREDLVTATRALDRTLWFNYYTVPHWFMAANRVTYWNKFSLPKTFPKFYYAPHYFREYSWIDPVKEKALNTAIKANAKLSI